MKIKQIVSQNLLRKERSERCRLKNNHTKIVSENPIWHEESVVWDFYFLNDLIVQELDFSLCLDQ